MYSIGRHSRAVAVAAWLGVAAASSGAGALAGDRQVAVVEDTVISGTLQRAFDADPAFAGHRIYVESYRGNVQLSGWVMSDAQKHRAVQVASETAGVRSVNDELELDPKADPAAERSAGNDTAPAARTATAP